MRHARRKGGFSLVEMLVALAIMGTLMTASLTALDTSFKSYKVTTEGASTHIIARMVMSRMMTMVRTGTQFGPYPVDALDSTQNPLTSDYIEFVTAENTANNTKSIVRIEKRANPDPAAGPFELWFVQSDFTSNIRTGLYAKPLLSSIQDVRFVLEYDVAENLKRATVDLTVRPTNFQAAFIGGAIEAPSIRLVSSVNPRKLD